MHYILLLVIDKLLGYLQENADEIIQAIRDAFPAIAGDPALDHAVKELGYDPCQEKLTALSDKLKEKGEDSDKLAQIIINKATV